MAKVAAEVDGTASSESVIALAETAEKVVTAIAEGALVKEGIAESDAVVEGVRTIDADEDGMLEALDNELVVGITFWAAANPRKRSASEGVLGRRISPRLVTGKA